jgi:hypothetical protein
MYGSIDGDAVQTLVRDAVQRCHADGPLDADALRRCAFAAHRAGIRAEEMVVALREVWRAQEDVPHPTFRDSRLTQLVDAALDAYYADSRATATPPPNSHRPR